MKTAFLIYVILSCVAVVTALLGHEGPAMIVFIFSLLPAFFGVGCVESKENR